MLSNILEIYKIVNNYNMINVGIIGCGFVGGALKDWLEHNNPECKLFISDPLRVTMMT